MNMTWINRGVYTLLERIGDFQGYFMSAARWFAAVCFLMALGMAVVKIFLQVCDARQELLKLLFTVVTYFIMIYFFPIAMRHLLSFGMNLGYGAVFSGGLYEADVSSSSGSLETSQTDFYNWLNENTGGIFSTSTTESKNGVKTALQFNIVDPNTGYIDLNKTFTYILAFVKIGWKCFPKLTLFNATFTAIGVCCLYTFALIVVIICYFVVLFNYIMCLIDYFALMGYGLLMIPLSLWEGTKSYTQAILGAIGKILIKLIVISSLMFLSIMSVVDLFTQVYIHSVIIAGVSLAVEIDDLLNMAVTLLFQAPLLAVITMQTEKIANFLSSGNPQLSFGDFALGAAQSAAMAGGAVHATKSIANAGAVVASGGASAIVGAAGARALGGGAKSMAKSAMSSAGSTVGGQLKSAAMNAPQSFTDGINNFSRMTGMQRANGGEAFVPSMPSSRPSGGAGPSAGGVGGGQMPSPSSSVPEMSAPDTSGSKTEGGGAGSDSSELSKAAASSGAGSLNSTADGMAQAQKSGISGIYGTVDGNLNSMGDRATAMANRMSQGGLASRLAGEKIGSVMGAVNTIRETHREHMDGNKLGNGYVKNVAKGYMASKLASSANAYGGSRVSIAKGDMKAPEALRGQSAAIYSRGQGYQQKEMSDGSRGSSKYWMSGNESFSQALNSANQGPTDKDAVDNIKDMNSELNSKK